MATELLDLTGRHLRERSPQRHAFTLGTHVRENRRGRTGPTPAWCWPPASRASASARGEVWGCTSPGAATTALLAEALPGGVRLLGGGELLLPGRGPARPRARSTRPPGCTPPTATGSTRSPPASTATCAARPSTRERRARSRSTPGRRSTSTTTSPGCTQLAEPRPRSASSGSCWTTAGSGTAATTTPGLGDWYVDEDVWPQGLHPLVDACPRPRHGVRAVGRARDGQPGLRPRPRPPRVGAGAPATGCRRPRGTSRSSTWGTRTPTPTSSSGSTRCSAEYHIDYLKWDHNRDLVEAGHRPPGRAGVHAQTLAVYRLLDELRARHPGVEIESCSSGGGRVDLGILERTDRVWASDCIDPLERQQIQRWTGLLLPPELIGSHVGSPHRPHDRPRATAWTSGPAPRCSATSASSGTSPRATDEEPSALAGGSLRTKELRAAPAHRHASSAPTTPTRRLWVHGVVAPDGSRAVTAGPDGDQRAVPAGAGAPARPGPRGVVPAAGVRAGRPDRRAGRRTPWAGGPSGSPCPGACWPRSASRLPRSTPSVW